MAFAELSAGVAGQAVVTLAEDHLSVSSSSMLAGSFGLRGFEARKNNGGLHSHYALTLRDRQDVKMLSAFKVDSVIVNIYHMYYMT